MKIIKHMQRIKNDKMGILKEMFKDDKMKIIKLMHRIKIGI